MRHQNRRALAMMLVLSLVCVCVGEYSIQSVDAAYEETRQEEQIRQEQETLLAESMETMVPIENKKEAQKEEVVYINTDSQGNVQDIIVSDWLKNYDSQETLKDASDLKDITNVKGDERFRQKDDGEILWEAGGKDIYYQGNSAKTLPIEVKITYYLDGKEIAPKDLAGKSGKVRIRFDYTNHEKRTVEINGVQEEIYVPFAVVSGMVLPTEHFTNVEVCNGKILSDGSKEIAVGLTFPGLKESLAFDGEQADALAGYFEVTADVTDFELSMTMTMCLNDMLGDVKLDDVHDLEDLENALNELSDASDKLVEGSTQLYEGTDTLKSKTSTFQDGVSTLNGGLSDAYAGTQTLRQGTSQLYQGADTLNSKVGELLNGMSALCSGSQTLVAGFEGENGALNGAAKLADGAGQVDAGVANLAEGTHALCRMLENSIGENNAKIQFLKEQYAALPLDLQTPEIQAQQVELMQNIAALEGANQALETIQLQLAQAGFEENVNRLKEGTAQLSSGSQALYQGLNSLYDGSQSLRNGAVALCDGGQQLQSGVAALREGASQVDIGAAALEDGAGQLVIGGNTLLEGTGLLAEGINTLHDGTTQLKDGMTTFDEEGIAKLTEAFDGDVQSLIDRLRALADAGKEYKVYTKLPENMDGSVKFILKTAEIS